MLFDAHEHAPDDPDRGLEILERALVGGNGLSPIPLIDVRAMVAIEEVIFLDRAFSGLSEVFTLLKPPQCGGVASSKFP